MSRSDAPHVDVLIITALQDELEAVLRLGNGGASGWTMARDRSGLRYHYRSFTNQHGALFWIAAAWSGEMGETAAATRATQLIDELEPACLAMCGICAGRRGEVSLGDVIVADRVYSYDHGKIVAHRGSEHQEELLFRDIETYNLEATWKMDAAFFSRDLGWSAELVKERPLSKDVQRRWLLHALFAHQVEGGASPLTSPERKVRCPDWTAVVKELRAEGLLEDKPAVLRLTDAGRDLVLEERLLDPDGFPTDPPFRVHVGPIATGKTVREDPRLFDALRRHSRKTLGVEMEGAAIGYVSARLGRRSIVAKAVSDYADHAKDERFRSFACRASAEFLLAFLCRNFEPPLRPRTRDEAAVGVVRAALPQPHGTLAGRTHNDFTQRVERVCRLRDPEAEIVRRAAPPPFSGVLLVSGRDGRLVRMAPVAVLDHPISEELIDLFITAIEAPYRRENPMLHSTIVHTGPAAPDQLLRRAARAGVYLKSFGEYQGLLDLTKYLAWQGERLARDPVYPSGHYVEQRAELWVGADRTMTEDALSTLSELLTSPHPRFVLLLGDFGTGKTFLLRELVRRMTAENATSSPILVEMRALEKGRLLNQLLAQHFAAAEFGRMPLDAFRYMLSDGQVALFFDGFDELAFRVTYERAVEHFDTILEAAEGNAKVVVSSRTAHFLTDHDIKRALAREAERVAGFRLLKLQPFDRGRIRRLLVKRLPSEADADVRLRLLDGVRDLLGLAENPRMLSFILELDPRDLEEARTRSGRITAARLYELLIQRWLSSEIERAKPRGAEPPLNLEQIWKAAMELAILLWSRSERGVSMQRIPSTLLSAVQVLDLDRPLDAEVAKQQIGSRSLLVRDDDGNFSFIHQSVLEWLVAHAAAAEVAQRGDAEALGVQTMSDLMIDFFTDLAGRDIAVTWARAKLASPGKDVATGNAWRVLLRLGVVNDGEAPGAMIEAQKLEGQDLRGYDFSHVGHLRGANLARADLTGATLVGTDLGGSCLAGARLVRADLRGANLTGADLRGADLSFARLLGAELRGANLEGAILLAAEFVGAAVDEPSPRWIHDLRGWGAAPPRPAAIEAVSIGTISACHAVAFSSDGVLLATAHDGGVIRLWEAATGAALRVLRGQRGPVQCVAFGPDGRQLASGAADRTVMLWDAVTGASQRICAGHGGPVQSVAWSPDGLALASGSVDGTVMLWDVAAGSVKRVFKGHSDRVLCVAWSPDGLTVASGSADGTVTLWEVDTGSVRRVLRAHTDWVQSVAWSPDGLTLASGSADGTALLWDVATGSVRRALEGHAGSVECVSFSPDGRTLASSSSEPLVILWEVATGAVLRKLREHWEKIGSVAWSPDGRTLASGSADRSVALWQAETGVTLRVLKGHAEPIQSVAFSPDGLTLASGSSDRTVTLWQPGTGTMLRVLKGHAEPIQSVAFSPDGLTLASGSSDRTVTLWQPGTGTMLRVLRRHAGGILSLAFSADGATLASGSNDRSILLWHVQTGMVLRSLKRHSGSVLSVAFSPDGLTLASGSADRTIALWDLKSRVAPRVLLARTDRVLSVAFSSDGRALASGSACGAVTLWQVETGTAVRVLDRRADSVWSVAWSPDGSRLASGSADGTVKLWQADTGSVIHRLEGHTDRVWSVAWRSDGRVLATSSEDGSIRLWDASAGACVASLLRLPEGWVAFTPRGRYRLRGDTAASFWHAVGLCRFEPGELDAHLAAPLRIANDEPILP
ncbi:pentapeptide repeat-containing protein [Sorangium sp. So ce394]|uniref:WD40 domain-containing protein n=1 Tax=Sorangium sp. So ce394 TaxID=3133310 RepID=UPI003F5B08B0